MVIFTYMKKEMRLLIDELAFIKEFNVPIVKIDENREYWLVRTNSGEYFEDFHLGNYIGINWNEFNDSEDFTLKNKNSTTLRIEETYTDNKQPGHTFSQINRFFHELKLGDIVMIPSKDSRFIAFGEISSHVYIETKSQTELDEGACPYEKRRKVTWIKTVARKRLDPYLYRMMNVHLTISNANDYADAIDRTIHSFYYKGDKSHLVLGVNQEKDISLIDLVDALSAPLELVDYMQNPLKKDQAFHKKNLDAKLRVQSQGVIEFVSSGAAFLIPVIAGLIIVGMVGGKANYKRTKETTEAGLESDGILGKVLQFVKHKDEHGLKVKELDAKLLQIKDIEKKLESSAEKLKIEVPSELSNYFNEEETINIEVDEDLEEQNK